MPFISNLCVACRGPYFLDAKKVSKEAPKPHATLQAAPTPRASGPSRYTDLAAKMKIV